MGSEITTAVSSWVEAILQPLRWVRQHFTDVQDAWGVFGLALGLYGTLFLILAFVGHLVLRCIATLIREAAESASAGGTTDELITLEASSARIARALNRIAYRLLPISFDVPVQPVRLPPGRGGRGHRMMRWMTRKLWLTAHHLITFVALLPRALMSRPGLLILVLAALTALPDAVRDGITATVSYMTQATWSEATAVTIATVAAAAIPFLIVLAKFLISDSAAAMRNFRRRRDEEALERLYEAMPALTRLSQAVYEDLHDMKRRYSIERYNAEQWHHWTQRTAPATRYWNWSHRDDHVECNAKCLEPLTPAPIDSAPVDDTLAAAMDVAAAWTSALRHRQAFLARLMTHRAWVGLVALRLSVSSEGMFHPHKLPSPSEWRHVRIAWQHRQLQWGPPSEADMTAGRSVAVEAEEWPGEAWLEEELRRRLWKLAELARELSDLADFAQSLARPRRLDKITNASA